jgi:hypothetical protein
MSATVISLYRPMIIEHGDPLTIPPPPANARRFSSFHKSNDACHSIVFFGRPRSGKAAMPSLLLAAVAPARGRRS